MKKLIQLLTLCLMATVLAVPVLAQDPAASPAAAPAAQDDAEVKAALYKKYTDNYKTNQPVAYEAAKEYVSKYPNDTDDIAKYLKDFVVKYEKGTRKADFTKALLDKKWAEAFALGKQIAAGMPEDLATNINTAWAGLNLALTGNNASNAEALNFSTKSLQLIDAGKTLEEGKPYPDKEKQDALGWLNYSLYLYNVRNNKSSEAAGYLIKALQYEGSIKNNPDNYLQLAAIYEAEYDRLQKDYTTRFGDKPKSPESEAALEHVKQVMDPLIDAIARAIAYSGTDPKTQTKRDELKKSLSGYYEFRHGSIDGLDALIAGVKAKPLPPPPSANESMPATAPATTSTPATPTGSNAASKTGAETTTNTTAPATDTATKPMPDNKTGPMGKKPSTAPATPTGQPGSRPKR